MKVVKGFTLVEMLIVLVILGVLLGIGFPAYQGYSLRAHRADAHESLLDISARLERFVAQNNRYTTEISAATGLGINRVTSAEGYYTLGIAACPAGNISVCYVITATATGPQTADTDCLEITYDSNGNRGGTTPGECW